MFRIGGYVCYVSCLAACSSSPHQVVLPDIELQLFQKDFSVKKEQNALNQYMTQGSWLWVQFWATSCATCVAEMPELINIQRRFSSRGLRLLAVAMPYDRIADIQAYLKERPVNFDVAYDHTGRLSQDGLGKRVVATPTAVLLDPNGKEIYRLIGKPDFRKLTSALDRLLPGWSVSSATMS